ncbi:MauE/DoxX family redox-associated membrane protein [Mucilaginibacter sp. L3T2-6]|uniref:MauE/DoxX family redox-associated membrane protein n=1 Tax=Mucilaginibacter sp. L3T2-6 TaxID=3062491 RepID=UPI0026758E43|nr:MauE/DoxX family redox-associated membrane protein [Mucilaginibacter sp. L3T2-6]MDO3641253.1 hypothetical protein [Mucilaginibacter sp. L3T2-6]MDV6213987.1 hypothetical protein [Mucilaginibacter sp. L3T2-6]
MRTFLKSLPSAALVLLYAYAAGSKLADVAAFRRELHRQPFPPGVADVLLYLLPAAELAVAALLLFGRTLRTGLQASLVLLVLFTGYILLAMLGYWEQVPCSCGGIISHLTWGQHLAFNCFCMAVNLMALHIYAKGEAGNPRPDPA